MKQAILALLAGVATGFVLPFDGRAERQISFSADIDTGKHAQDAPQAWWDDVSERGSPLSSIKNTIDSVLGSSLVDDLLSSDLRHPHDGHGHHGDPTKTIYELVKESKYTQRFAELISEYDEIKELLEDTKKNRTLFVPTDRAFEHIPKHKKPSKEFILALLKYHVVPGSYPVKRILFTHTVPTELELDSLDERPQRLRIGVSLFGVHLNFYSKVVAANIEAKNGIIHAVDHILIPPPSAAKIIKLLPGKFSTFSLALETTGLGEDLEEAEHRGGTLFAPTNIAFKRLGPRANAFLFSEHGKRFLHALLRYHVVANETLYSDAFYKEEHSDRDDHDSGEEGADTLTDYWHVDLPSLLDEKPIHVDFRRWKGFITILVNGGIRVAVQDGIAADGVIQVVDRVLIPPHKRHHHGDDGDDGDDGSKDDDENLSVEELKARLSPYVEDGPSEGGGMGDL
ncbi:fasciclin domain family [Podospora appendiculata]|uniref:Fasciclin domain family n=1 Tax=Podospora appendiculata TaxID=314037 RepID=A0AAE0XLP1_9PEZI|nr:fasciclin domain family [Podospora appendiculata]